MNGMVPPSPIHIAGLPKWVFEDSFERPSPATARSAARASRCRHGRIRIARARRTADRLPGSPSAAAPALSAFTVGGRRSESTSRVCGRSTLPALAGGGRPSAPVTARNGRQVRFSTRSERSACIGSMPGMKGNLRQISSPSTSAARRACVGALRRDLRVEGGVLDDAGVGGVDALEQHARDAEARGHHAARVAGVHALGQHFDREDAVHQAAQRGRAPELLVVAAAGVEADHQVRSSESSLTSASRYAGRSSAAALLAALDEDRDARRAGFFCC